MVAERPEKRGALLVFLSAICFSTSGFCFKMAEWDALSLGAARSFIALFPILCFALITKHKFRINRNVLLAGLGGACSNMFNSLANKMTTAGNTIVLQFTMPVFVILIMWLFYRQKPTKGQILTTALVILGIVLFFVDSISAGHLAGDCFAVLAGVFLAIYFIFNSRENSDPFVALFIAYLFNIGIGVPSLLKVDFASTSALTWLVVGILGLLQQGLGHIFFSLGIVKTNPVTAALVSGIEPVINPILVAILVSEMLTPLAIVGAVLVVATVTIYNFRQAKGCS